jgi:hypothetical protein
VLWSDSSGTAAGGVILDIGWLRFPWTQEIIAATTSPNDAIDIVSLEGAALAITAETLARHPIFDPARGISIGIDSESFIFACLKGRSNCAHVHRCLSFLFDITPLIRFTHINSDANPSDFPSRPLSHPEQVLLISGQTLRAVTPSSVCLATIFKR